MIKMEEKNHYFLKIAIFGLIAIISFVISLKCTHNKFQKWYIWSIIIYSILLIISLKINNIKIINFLHNGLSFFTVINIFVDNLYIKISNLIFLILLLISWKCHKNNACIIDLYTNSKYSNYSNIFHIFTYIIGIIFIIQIIHKLYFSKINKSKKK